jgi:hypothetical protein
MTRAKPRYLSYLLRLWQAGSEGRPVWRASLESPRTGERISFLGSEDLFAYLERQIAAAPAPSEGVEDEVGQ